MASFYKIMLPSIINDNKLRIPEDFAKIYENELSSYATLVVPNGSVFRVRVEKAGSTLWLHNGWKKFAEHHSICCGFFLLFDYEGNSEFKVHIFDLTATEINYPKNSLGNCEEPKYGNKLRKRESRSEACCRPTNTLVSRPIPIFSNDEIVIKCSLSGDKRKICVHSVLPILLEFAPEFAMRINEYGKCISKSFVDSFRNKSPYTTRNKRIKVEDVAFEDTPRAVVLFNSCVESENEELIPKNHEKDGLSPDNAIEFFSNESDLQIQIHNADKEGQQLAEDSGDMQLATQIIEDEDPVTVKEEEEELSRVNGSGIFGGMSRIQEKQNAISAAMMLKLTNPYFMIILKQYNVGNCCILHVPSYFGKKYLSSDTKFLTLEGPNCKHWKVSCLVKSEVQYLSQEWVEFVKDNNLVEADVCIFELIQAEDMVLKVHIFRTC